MGANAAFISRTAHHTSLATHTPMSNAWLTDSQLAQFAADGYLLVEGLLDGEEAALLRAAAKADAAIRRHAMDVADTQGRKTNLSLWNHPGDDVYGMVARS